MDAYVFVDRQKVLYHFSSVAYKTLLCPHYKNEQRILLGCEYSPMNVCFQIGDEDDRYGGSASLRSLPHRKCVFVQLEDIQKETPTGKEWRIIDRPQSNTVELQEKATGAIVYTFEMFDPKKFNRGYYRRNRF